MKFTLYLSVLLVLASCSSETDRPKPFKAEEPTSYVAYENEELGWSTEYDGSFEVILNKEEAELKESGHDAMEDVLERQVIDEDRELLSVRIGEYNAFTSVIQPYYPEKYGDPSVNAEITDQQIVELMESTGLGVVCNTDEVTIDGLKFHRAHFEYLSPDGGSTPAGQINYSHVFDNEKKFTMSVTYINHLALNQLREIVDSSKFKETIESIQE